MRVISLVNLKPGTAKTTSAVWLAHALHQQGERVLLVDADPTGSALRWSEQAEFPFAIVGLAVKDLHRRTPEIATGLGVTVVVIDAPQLEDHAGIAMSAVRLATDVLIPVAPSPIELDRMAPIRDAIDSIDVVKTIPTRVAVLLNRVITRAGSGPGARTALTSAGFFVLDAQIPRKEIYTLSFGRPIPAGAADYAQVARELLATEEIH